MGGKCWGELVRDQKGGEGELRVSLHSGLGEGTLQPWPDEDPENLICRPAFNVSWVQMNSMVPSSPAAMGMIL